MMLKTPLPRLQLKTLCLSSLAALALLVAPAHAQPAPLAAAPAHPAQQQPSAGQSAVSLKLRWAAKPRVKRYRLQVALDQKFTDIVFDRAVEGVEQEVSGLQPGKYYWRVAPATPETGRYSAPVLVEATTTPTTTATTTATTTGTTTTATKTATPSPVLTLIRPPADVGWQAAIGSVARPFAARLRTGKNFDLVALNSDGILHVLDGGDGTALWSARARGNAPAASQADKARGGMFTPLVVPATADTKAVVSVASADGVRGLDGETGREVWRTILPGRLQSGVVAQLQGESAAPEVVVVTSDPDTLTVLEAQTGRIVSKTKLSAAMLGSPIPFTHGEVNAVAYALVNRQLEIRRRDGTLVRAIKFDVPFTTPPLILATPRGTLVIIGTDHGLLFFEGSELKPLGRITTEQDAPRGRLTAADIDNDGTIEIVMVTQNGRVAVISTVGKVNWAVEGATDAYMATFANLNNDGVLDVLVASDAAFALGFSGRDGELIWRADDNPKTTPAGAATGEKMLRTLTGALSSAGVPLLVGGDASRSSVRAVGLPVVVNKASK